MKYYVRKNNSPLHLTFFWLLSVAGCTGPLYGLWGPRGDIVTTASAFPGLRLSCPGFLFLQPSPGNFPSSGIRASSLDQYDGGMTPVPPIRARHQPSLASGAWSCSVIMTFYVLIRSWWEWILRPHIVSSVPVTQWGLPADPTLGPASKIKIYTHTSFIIKNLENLIIRFLLFTKWASIR